MDLGKDQSRSTLHQTPGPHQEENHVPEIIGTWNLRNREQLRKRKEEAQEKQTSQWQFGYEKKCKRPRMGKGNKRGRKRQQNTDLKVEPQSQFKKDMREKALAPMEKELEPPRTITEALYLVASPKKVVPEKQIFAMDQEGIIHQANSSETQETAIQNHSSETCQDMADPEVLSPKISQETAVLQGHPSKIMCPDMTKPEDLSPNLCQEIAVLQGHPFRMAEPEDLAPKLCQETAVVKVLPSKTEDTANLEGCYAHETYQKRDEPEEYNSEPDQGIAEIESFLPKTEEIAVPKDLSTKTHQETVEPEHFSHETYKEIAVPKAPSHKTIQEMPTAGEYPPEIYQETPESEDSSPEIYQETPGSEDYSPEIYQETPGPEDLSTNTYKNKDVSQECFPEPYQETDGPQGQDPKAHQEDAKDVYTFPQEMREKPKAEEPEIPAIPNVPQEIHPENDVYSYVLF
uniref:Hemogen n=1 Tax=Panthera tigris altaica TaxID=74533 RepID=A0A8C9K5T6_PANTA